MIKGVIFDFDNTLYNYDIANEAGINAVLESIHETHHLDKNFLRDTYNKINAAIKHSNNPSNKFNKIIYIKQILEQMNIPISFLCEYLSCYTNTFTDHFYLYEGVVEFIQLLKKHNVKIGILSNNIFIQQYEKLQQANITQYIDYIQTSDECGEEKPHINMFLNISHKMQAPFTNLAYIGDNYQHDIAPSLNLAMMPFHFVVGSPFKLENNYITIGGYIQLYDFFNEYYHSVNELIFFSKYFGQSPLTTQGPGGNISVKMGDLMFIKSSGSILGNMSYDQGYCIVDKNKTANLKKAKLFGYGNPSMETHFHSFMKKYTVHVHFTLANAFLCSGSNATHQSLHNFEYEYKVIEYCPPGSLLAEKIKENYDTDTGIYFLKNHGLIITANSYDEILYLFEYTYKYFNSLLKETFQSEWESFTITRNIYEIDRKSKVVRKTDISAETMKNLVYCFPDLAVFVQKVAVIDDLRDLSCNSDAVIYKDTVYIIAENMTKAYYSHEILNEYSTLLKLTPTFLEPVMDVNYLRNMEEEKLRR